MSLWKGGEDEWLVQMLFEEANLSTCEDHEREGWEWAQWAGGLTQG